MTAELLSRLDTHRRQREARGATQQEVQLLSETHAALTRAEVIEARLALLEVAAAVAYVPLDALVQVEDHSPSLRADVRRLAAAATEQLGAALRLAGGQL